jgi:RNA polymerase sigma-70 factor (ECF subfamily)
MRDQDFTRLYNDHAQPLFAFLSYRTGDSVLAEDLMADTFEQAYKARRRYDPRRASERTWLYAIALNRVRDSARRSAVESRALARIGAPDDSLAETALAALERKEALREALDRLSVKEREALALRFGADLPLAEIASLVDDPQSTVEARIYRGLRKLRDLLGDDF